MGVDAEILDRVDPGKVAGALHPGGDEHAPIEAAASGVESLQAVDGRKAGLGIVKGEQFPVDGVPGFRFGAFRELLELGLRQMGKSRLRGRVSQRIGGCLSQDLVFRDLQNGVPRALVKASTNSGLPDFQKTPAEGVVIPVSAL